MTTPKFPPAYVELAIRATDTMFISDYESDAFKSAEARLYDIEKAITRLYGEDGLEEFILHVGWTVMARADNT